MKLDFRSVKSVTEIKQVSKLAYTLFPIDYGDYVSQDHIQDFLDLYQSETAIAKQIAEEYYYFLVYLENEIIGYTGFVMEENILKLSKLYLVLSMRSKGIGHVVMEWLDDFAERNHCERIELLVLVENVRAIDFYKRIGYSVVEVYEEHFKSGESEQNYKMEKRLK